MDTKTNSEQAASASAVRTLSLADIVARSPDPITALDKLGFWLAKSGMFGCDRLEAGHVIALTCISEGLSPAEFFRTYHVLGGKVVKRAEAVLADFRRRGGAFRWVEDGTDGKTASAVFTFGGQEKTARYTLEDATKAGLVKAGSGWLTRPANMLRARVSTNGVRMLCPEVFGGEYDEETTSAPAPGLDLTAPPPPPPTTTAAEAAPEAAQAPAAPAAPARRASKPKAVTEAPAAPASDPQGAAPDPAASPKAGDKTPTGTIVSHVPDPAPPGGSGYSRVFPPSKSGIADAPAIASPAAAQAPAVADPIADPPALPDDVQAKLAAAIGNGDNIVKAREWLIKKGWLTAGVPLECLPLQVAEKILAKVDRFREAAGLS